MVDSFKWRGQCPTASLHHRLPCRAVLLTVEQEQDEEEEDEVEVEEVEEEVWVDW